MMTEAYQIGMAGLGVMGRNLLLNLADHGFAVAGYDTDPGKVEALAAEAKGRKIRAVSSAKECLALLSPPRAVLLLVPAGPAVDAAIAELVSLMEPGDIIIDGGNSHFRDTEERGKRLADVGIRLLGLGISGGAYGARHGASLMPGGPKEVYDELRPLLEAAAARVAGEPCLVYLGEGGAGHFVKMVHNGIEYGLLELIAESYDLMKRGMGLTNDELAFVYAGWNQGGLRSYLMEITSLIPRRIDEKTGKGLLDVIADGAGQKGTGKWTSQTAMDLHVPVPVIDAAVSVRDISACGRERREAACAFAGIPVYFRGVREAVLESLEKAMEAAFIITYAQGFDMLKKARALGYGIDLAAVARIWRGGCIIRAAVLEKITRAFKDHRDLPHLLADGRLGRDVADRQRELRAALQAAMELGIPVPALMAALSYFDAYRSARLPTNLIQAQRDYFGAHGYERTDAAGQFHTEWEED
ncbi:MAG: NADP-dependent phosphogluconate dehydrogenase [Smithellaceae bacterium]|nr:NADP-dependent phosphogluconate dehydrogenase [Smithellaceae bacterium]